MSKINPVNVLRNFEVDKYFKLHISHTDLDGKGCFVIDGFVEIANGIKMIETEPNDVADAFIDKCIEREALPSLFIVTDLSFNKKDVELLEFLTEMNENKTMKVLLIDHHASALWLNDYPWAFVDTSSSATLQYYNYYIKDTMTSIHKFICTEKTLENLKFYAERVSRYDTYAWKSDDKYFLDEWESIWQSKLTTKAYITHTRVRIVNDTIQGFDVLESSIIAKYIAVRQEKLEAAAKRTKTVKFKGIVLRVVIADINASSFGDMLLEEGSDDIAAVLYMDSKKLSLRTKSEKNDLSKISLILAKDENSGGGHPKAAGCILSDSDFVSLIQEVIKE